MNIPYWQMLAAALALLTCALWLLLIALDKK